MRRTTGLLLASSIIGCGAREPAVPSAADDAGGVRSFVESVARDVTRDGPMAWQTYFEDVPSFFMAANGQLVFADGAAAKHALPQIAQSIPHVELAWGHDMRIDPVAPGVVSVAAPYREVRISATGERVDEAGFFTAIAYRRDGRWRFRNVHWSAAR